MFTIKQKPTPQLKVFIISESLILFFFNHLKIGLVLILDKLIFIDNVFGITLIKLSRRPPPVIFAHPLINFLLLILFIGVYVYKNHDDFPYYHFPYTYYLTQSDIHIGVGNFGHGFRTSSSIFYLNSLLKINMSVLKILIIPLIFLLSSICLSKCS